MVNGTEEAGRFLSLTAAVVLSVVTASILLLDVIGNTLVLFVVYRQRIKPNLRVGNIFIANLSVIDLMMGIFLIPTSINVTLRGSSVVTDAGCKFNGFFNIFVGSASIWTLAVISIDRYVASVCAFLIWLLEICHLYIVTGSCSNRYCPRSFPSTYLGLS